MLRYKCEQCGLYFSEDGGVVDDQFLEHSPMFIYRFFEDKIMHPCYGNVPDGKQRFYGIAKLVGWTYRYVDGGY